MYIYLFICMGLGLGAHPQSFFFYRRLIYASVTLGAAVLFSPSQAEGLRAFVEG